MLNYLSTVGEILDSQTDTAVLPIGSTEQHGHHLPVGTDSIIARAVAEKVADKIGAYLLPVLSISTCSEHRGKKGSVWLKADTLYYIVKDIASCLKEQGFKKLVLILGHGGLFVVGPAVREINAENRGINVINIDLLDILHIKSREAGDILESRSNLHACEYETSLMLFLREELVKKDLAVDCEPQVPRSYLNYASIFKFCKDGVWGRPTLATREKGGKLFELLVQGSLEYTESVTEIFKEGLYR